ncbi:unnamed protein product [Rhodiola kirilowii]
MDDAEKKEKSRERRDKDRDYRHHREYKHRSSKDDDDEEEDRYRTDKHRDSDRHRRHHHRSDGENRDESRKSKKEGSKDYKREGSRDRDRDSRRERSPDRAREESKTSYKRKDRGGSEDNKVVRVSDRDERRREEDKNRNEDRKEMWVSEDAIEDVKDADGGARKMRRLLRDEAGEEVEEDEKKGITEVRSGKRKFEDGVKEEPDVEGNKRPHMAGIQVKEEPDDEQVHFATDNSNSLQSSSVANGAVAEPHNLDSENITDKKIPSSFQPPTKVSSITTTNENKGVNNNRIHEVPGKSSTDGSSSAAGKTGNFSLDAIAKAKKALQKRKEIEEKMKKLPGLHRNGKSNSDIKSESGVKIGVGSSPSVGTLPAVSTVTASVRPPTDHVMPSIAGIGNLSGASFEAVKRAQELAAKMGFRKDPEFSPLINLFPGQLPSEVSILPKPAKAPVLRLDALGREIDEEGNVVNIMKPTSLSTLKVNINKQKKDAFQILKPEFDFDPESNPYFDPLMGLNKNKLLRPKRMTFQFVEEGKWSKEAEHLKLKSQFGEAQAKDLKAKQAQYAKAKAEPDINPNLIEVSERVITKRKPKDPIPEIEWWDMPLLLSGNLTDIGDADVTDDKLKMEKITIYVEHPRPIEPPAEPAPPPPQPLKLTKKEQKKLRTQRRLAREKERQEMIRQGLLEPPKPKVKMSNLMKVLGSEATQDPTKLEMEIRSAAAEREQAHVDRNIARKLTPAERREKKEKKLFDDPNTLETIVSVYKIIDLSRPQLKFKVEVNAKENRLTGCTVVTSDMSVVVVEGGNKSIKRYGKLMLNRINWAASMGAEDENEEKPVNKCVLVWQGSVAKPAFTKFYMHNCLTEAAARKVFNDAGVVHYWELAEKFSDEDQV